MFNSWEVMGGELEPLSVALYLRDVMSLSPAVPPLPRVDNPSGVRVSVPGGELSVVEREWSEWWDELVAACANAPGLGRLVHWSDEQESAFARRPHLYAVAAAALVDAVRWAVERREEFASARSSVTLADLERDRAMRLALSRAMRWRWWWRTVRLRVVAVPVPGHDGYRASHGLFVVTAALALDNDALLRWLPGHLDA